MNRIEILQQRIAEQGVDLLVVNPSPSFTYLTGHEFTSHERLFLLLVPKEGPAAAVVPLLERGNWTAAVPSVDAVYTWDDKDGAESASDAAFKRFAGAKKVAIEPLAMRYMEVQHLMRGLPDATIVDGDDLVLAMRQCKDKSEADSMRRAAEIAEAALEQTLALVRPGINERTLAAHLSSGLLSGGGEGISFGPIVLGGAKSALPHGVPGDYTLKDGDYLLIDFGTAYNGYHCDITRTFVVGNPNDRQRSVYEAVKAGNAAGVARATVGATSHEVHKAAEAPLLAPEFEGFLRHRTGHGLGLDIHEPPSVMEGNHDPLPEGTVITVEPGLYLEGWGGVRIEDDIWVTSDGPVSLTSFDRELRSL